LGNPNKFTALEQTQEIISLTHLKSKSKTIHLPLPQSTPKQPQPTIVLAKEKLENEESRILLKQGLHSLI